MQFEEDDMCVKFSVNPNDRFPTYEETHFVQIEEGTFEGVCFNFNSMEFGEEVDVEEDGSEVTYGKVNFDFVVLYAPESIAGNLRENPLFETVLGQILHKILLSVVSEQLEEALLEEEGRQAETEENIIVEDITE